MAREIMHGEVHATFTTPDHTRVRLAPSVEGVQEIEVTALLDWDGFWQFKGWGSPKRLPLNGSMIDGWLVQLFENDPQDPDLINPWHR